MKTWKNPEVEELEISQTAYFALTGKYIDGYYISNDKKYKTPTFSGQYSKDVPFDQGKS